jgi:hypothetical protein
MLEAVKTIPERDLALLIAVVAIGVVIVGIFLIKPVLRLFIGRGDPTINDAIGYGTASFSLFYAVLIGLLVVASYQNRERVEQSILAEAGAVSGLYASMESYPEPTASAVRSQLRDYVLFTIHKDWPAHRQGEFMDGGERRVDAMRRRLAGFQPATTAQEILHRETLVGFQRFVDARQARLNGTLTRIPPLLWSAVLVGAVINLLILIMLRIRLVAHVILAAISAFFLGVVLYVILVLDDPLRGETGLEPTPFELLWSRRMVWDEPLQ